MNKTKIVCSIGPTSNNIEIVEKMIDAGMNVARFNMSHGDHDSHKKMIDIVKEARKNKNVPIAILIDTKGPEIRIKQFKNEHVNLKVGDEFVLTTEDVVGDKTKVSVTYKNLPKILQKDAKLLLNDGNIEFKVEKLTKTDVICSVVHGGILSNNKSINLPGIKTDMPYLSEQDKKDLIFAKEMNADFVAISFVGSAQDIKDVKVFLKSIDYSPKIISKIESQEGVKNFNKILKVSDGIMVARGDLGVEVDFVKIPVLQKEFIKKCNQQGKFVITATQMLESMINNPRPTRAEISDVANAIFDGTTAIMLSGETASGKHPAESVEIMRAVALEIENYTHGSTNTEIKTQDNSESIGYAVYALSQTENVKAIVAITQSGKTAENISKFKPVVPIIACTQNESTYHSLSMFYGVNPVLNEEYQKMDALNKAAIEKTLKTKIVKKGDKVVLVSGQIAGKSGSNTMMIKKL